MRRIPNYLTKFLLKMGMLMLIFTLCRILFFIYNSHHFPEVGFADFLVGLWFDLITTCLLFYPLIIIELFPLRNRSGKWFKRITLTLTLIAVFFGSFLNLVDVEYFHHTAARSNYGLFTMLRFGNDLWQQMPSFLADYWLLLILLIGFVYSAVLTLLRIEKKQDDSADWKIWKQVIVYVMMIGLFILIGRGGFVSKPIRPSQAAKYTEASNVQLVLNSAFTVINSWGSYTLEELDYFNQEELVSIYSTSHQYDTAGRNKGHNVVILIMESFSIEYIGGLNNSGESYTPFFDHLIDSSLVFPNAFANGKKSLDAVPAVLSSIPKLMKDEYMLSNYLTNETDALPKIFNDLGYQTAFFHGATNGSMNFDSYCDLIGFESYYGRSEYNNEEDYDGTWGIYDDKFLPWSVDQISKMKAPFFSTIFTISPHPPYQIPDSFESNKEDSEMENATRYADYALEKFFNKAKQQGWFENTLFVLVADHTPGTSNKNYSNDLGITHIPLLMYHPTDTFYHGVNNKVVGQIDIMPSILDQIGYDQPFFSFGESFFSEDDGSTACMIGDRYIYIGNKGDSTYIMTYQDEEVIQINAFENIDLISTVLGTEIEKEFEQSLKAMIQSYHSALIKNDMTVD